MYRRSVIIVPPPKVLSCARTLAVLLALTFGPASLGQTPSQSTTEEPLIVTNVNEVTLDVVAREKDKPDLDLKP